MYTTTKDIKNEILSDNGVKKVYFLHNKIKIYFESNNDLFEFLNKYYILPMNVISYSCSPYIFKRCLNLLYSIKDSIYYLKEDIEDNILILTKMPEKYLNKE